MLIIIRLVEETQNLSSNVLSSCLFMIHDTSTGSKNNETELTRWQKFDDPFLEILQLDVETRADTTSLVQSIRVSGWIFDRLVAYLTVR
jgi:hypothetical protein